MHTSQIRIALFTLILGASFIASAAVAAPVRIGVSERVAVWPLIIAQERGYFEKQKVEVTLVPMATTQAHFDLLDEEAIDLMTLTADQLLRAEQYGYELDGALLLGESVGADVIVTSEGLDNTRSLRGQRVGFEAAGAGELLLRQALQRKGLSLEDVEAVRLPTSGAASNGADDNPPLAALVLQAPWLDQTTLTETLYSSRQTAGLIMDTLAGREQWIDSNKDALKGIIRAWNDAVAWQARSPSGAAEIIAQALQLDASRVISWMDTVRALGTAENVQAFGGDYQKAFMSMSETMQPVLGSERALLSANDYFSLAALRQVAAGR